MVFSKITMTRALSAFLFGLFISACIEFGESIHTHGSDSVFTTVTSWLNLPIRLFEWPVTFIYVKIFGPTQYPNPVWLGRGGIEWVFLAINCVLYGLVFYWCRKRISMGTKDTGRASGVEIRMLGVGLSLVTVSVTAVLLIIHYYDQYGGRNPDPVAPPWIGYSFPFYVTGIGGIFLSIIAIAIIVGRKIRGHFAQ